MARVDGRAEPCLTSGGEAIVDRAAKPLPHIGRRSRCESDGEAVVDRAAKPLPHIGRRSRCESGGEAVVNRAAKPLRIGRRSRCESGGEAVPHVGRRSRCLQRQDSLAFRWRRDVPHVIKRILYPRVTITKRLIGRREH